MSLQNQQLYEFGNFLVDIPERQLLSDGTPVPLTPKTFDTLVLLLENAGRLVDKDTFMSRLWPDTVVEDASLAQNISQLRKALREGTDDKKYIETVPKRGYRFVAPVQLVAKPTSATPEAAIETPVASAAASPNRVRLWLAAAIAVIVLIMAVALLSRRPKPAPTSAEIHSIAVLPLENLSGDPNQDYLCDGLTDELITDLARVQTVRVISRKSTISYKHTQKTLAQIAKELNVDALVEGSVAIANDRIRVRAQLVRVANDEHLWADAYERNINDVLALQADLAQDITRAIRGKLPDSTPSSHSINAEAHQLYLKGRFFWNKRDRDGLEKALSYFEQAIAKDPNYAAAYSGLADCYMILGGYGIIPQLKGLEKAKAAAEKAISLDDDLAEAHASLGLINTYSGWNWEEAKRQFERAIELNPSYATAHHWYGDCYLAPVGRIDDAIVELRKAQELDPLSPVIVTDIGKELYFARRYDEAIAELRKALELDPNFIQAHGWLSGAYLEKGMHKEAVTEDLLARRDSKRTNMLLQDAYLAARAGQKEDAHKLLREAIPGLKNNYVDPGAIAVVYAALGEKDQAFQWLEKSYEGRSSFMTSLKMWPVYDPLRDDPRFNDLVRRVGLSQ